MLRYHYRKGHTYVLENPLSSLLWRFPAIRRTLRRHGAVRVVVQLGYFGASTIKPVTWTNYPIDVVGMNHKQ